MARNTSVELGDEIAKFIDSTLETGRFASASEMIRAGLRLLQDQEMRSARLRAAITEGLENGDPMPFDMDEFIASQKAKS